MIFCQRITRSKLKTHLLESPTSIQQSDHHIESTPSCLWGLLSYQSISTHQHTQHTKHSLGTNTNASGQHSLGMQAVLLEEDAKHLAYIPLVVGSITRLLASLATALLELIETRQVSMGSSSLSLTTFSNNPNLKRQMKMMTTTIGN